MSDLFFLYAILALSILLALLGILLVNLLILPRLADYAPLDGKTAPTVTVLIPARNEEAKIESCLLSILGQDYSNYEVWLYDDGSTDRTPEITARLAAEHPHLRITAATEEPLPGWLGKAHACHRLYLAMRAERQPDYLLFTDADVVFEPGALSHAVAAIENVVQNKPNSHSAIGLLSAFPRQITGSWAERLAVPLFLHWAVYTFLPLPLAFTQRTGPLYAAANGQFMLFRREAYEACGGHEAVRAEILEDVALARAVKRAGYRALLADGGPLIRTRMYNGAGEVWRGYSKNAYSFFGYSPFFAGVGVATLLTLYVAPLPLTLYATLSSQLSLLTLSLAQYALGILPRVLLAARFRYRMWDALLHPIGVLFQIAILLNSAWWTHAKRGIWKGRPQSPPQDPQ